MLWKNKELRAPHGLGRKDLAGCRGEGCSQVMPETQVGEGGWAALSQLGGEKSHRLEPFLCQPIIPSVLVTW